MKKDLNLKLVSGTSILALIFLCSCGDKLLKLPPDEAIHKSTELQSQINQPVLPEATPKPKQSTPSLDLSLPNEVRAALEENNKQNKCQAPFNLIAENGKKISEEEVLSQNSMLVLSYVQSFHLSNIGSMSAREERITSEGNDGLLDPSYSEKTICFSGSGSHDISINIPRTIDTTSQEITEILNDRIAIETKVKLILFQTAFSNKEQSDKQKIRVSFYKLSDSKIELRRELNQVTEKGVVYLIYRFVYDIKSKPDLNAKIDYEVMKEASKYAELNFSSYYDKEQSAHFSERFAKMKDAKLLFETFKLAYEFGMKNVDRDYSLDTDNWKRQMAFLAESIVLSSNPKDTLEKFKIYYEVNYKSAQYGDKQSAYFKTMKQVGVSPRVAIKK